MIQLRGLGLQVKLDASQFDQLVKQIARQTEYWVLGPRKLPKRA